ncbi:MAG TPA: hypothetical protein VGD37_16650 [Kofleriaceae bacterium]
MLGGLLAARASAQPAPATAPAAPGEPPAAAVPAQDPPAGAPAPPPPRAVLSPRVEIHGFVSEGAFVETANDYFGSTSRAGLELFEAGINLSTEVTDRLRAGLQLFTRDLGSIRDPSPRLDWAFLDYRWRRWLGVRAGIVKMPFGLYNEYADIDAARLPILLPSSVYPIRDRDVLLSHTGFGLYGSYTLGRGGELEYQAWLGTLTIPRTALQLTGGASLDSVNTRYVTGGQLFWRPPIDGLRLGATFVRASIDFHVGLDAALVAALVAAGLAPMGYDGKLLIAQRPVRFLVGSVEYIHGDWLFAAEYSRWLTHQRSSLPALSPMFDRDSEKLYAMATYRVAPALEAGGYYSVFHLDVDDMPVAHPGPFDGFQRDLAATLRLDVNDHWLWKLEAHFMDGTASLPSEFNSHPDRYWGMFLLRTTVTF